MILSARDEPTIRNILQTRLESLPGVAVLDWKITPLKDAVRVDVLLDVDALAIGVKSAFELPRYFEKRQLLNEIDEIAEGVARARRELAGTELKHQQDAVRVNGVAWRGLPGTGLRSRSGRVHV